MAGSGQFFSFSETGNTRRTIANVINNITPTDIPCISYFGLNNQSKFRLENFPNHKYEWLEDTLKVRTGTIAEDMTTTETDLTVTTGQGIRYKVGDVWKHNTSGEIFLVTAVSTDTLTIVRNWTDASGAGETTGVAWTNGDTVTYLYSARLEGADSDRSYWTSLTNPYNYSQIMHAEVFVSDSELNATSRYGVSDQFMYQLNKFLGGAGAGNGKQGRAGDLMIDLENTFFSTQKKKQRTSTVPGAMGGFQAFVTTNVSSNGGTARYLTPTILENSLQTIWEAGGMPDVIICNAFQKRLISSFYSGSVTTERSERTGGVVINKIETEFGTYDLMLNRRCDPDKIFIAQRDKIGWITLRPFAVKPLAEDGDYTKKQIVGEFGFVVENETAHGLIKDLKTS